MLNAPTFSNNSQTRYFFTENNPFNVEPSNISPQPKGMWSLSLAFCAVSFASSAVERPSVVRREVKGMLGVR